MSIPRTGAPGSVAERMGLDLRRIGRGGRKTPTIVRVLSKATINAENGCWEWQGARNEFGYGIVRDVTTGIDRRAHRMSYELLVGPIPAGLNIDHLCSNPRCINPAHLEPVTQAENVRRGRAGWQNKIKTHCVHGHEFTPENTLIKPGTQQRTCRTCRDRRIREFKQRQKNRGDSHVV